MTEQQLNDVWTYDQSEQTPTAVIKDSEGFDVGYVRGTGLDPRESAEKLAWRIVADHNLNLLAMAAPAVQRGPAVHTFYVLHDATEGQKYIKKDVDDGCLAIFEREEDAQRAKRRHPGTEYKRVDYYTAPQATEQQPTRRKKPMSYPNGLDMEPMPGLVEALEMRVDGKESVIDSPLDACHAGRPAMTTPWIPCDCCDDFVCTVHEQHAWECACPPIDIWVEAGHDPYLDDVTPELKAWVEDNPIDEED